MTGALAAAAAAAAGVAVPVIIAYRKGLKRGLSECSLRHACRGGQFPQ